MAKHYTFKQVAPNILGVEFKSEAHMSLMFMRIQDYTEGMKNARGMILREGDHLIQYLNKHKSIYYTAGWAGFNIRGDMLNEILDKWEDSTLWNDYEDELTIQALILRNLYGSNYFIIAWTKGDKASKKHEICHARYYLDHTYRSIVNDILSRQNVTKAKKRLKKMGYNVSNTDLGRWILLDEINAYAMCDGKSEIVNLGLKPKTVKKLRSAYKRYVK